MRIGQNRSAFIALSNAGCGSSAFGTGSRVHRLSNHRIGIHVGRILDSDELPRRRIILQSQHKALTARIRRRHGLHLIVLIPCQQCITGFCRVTVFHSEAICPYTVRNSQTRYILYCIIFKLRHVVGHISGDAVPQRIIHTVLIVLHPLTAGIVQNLHRKLRLCLAEHHGKGIVKCDHSITFVQMFLLKRDILIQILRLVPGDGIIGIDRKKQGIPVDDIAVRRCSLHQLVLGAVQRTRRQIMQSNGSIGPGDDILHPRRQFNQRPRAILLFFVKVKKSFSQRRLSIPLYHGQGHGRAGFVLGIDINIVHPRRIFSIPGIIRLFPGRIIRRIDHGNGNQGILRLGAGNMSGGSNFFQDVEAHRQSGKRDDAVFIRRSLVDPEDVPAVVLPFVPFFYQQLWIQRRGFSLAVFRAVIMPGHSSRIVDLNQYKLRAL